MTIAQAASTSSARVNNDWSPSIGEYHGELDTTFGDDLVPTMRDWMIALNGLLPTL